MLAERVTIGDSPEMDETDGGRPKAARSRLCIVTRQVKPIEDLLRFVADPAGVVTPDLKAQLPGRGVWVSFDAGNVAAAVKRKAFSRGLKREVKTPADLAAQVDQLLGDRAREALAIANKAGGVVTGFAKVEAALSHRILALLHARGAAEDSSGKLDRRYRAIAGERAVIIDLFDGEQMDLALGRANVVHAALTGGPAALACLDRIRSLLRYRASALTLPVPLPERTGGAKPAAGTDQE